ncbi:MAG: hypothetical protein J0M03_09525 [Acidobacteria bacterium]|nr:hypothetical protein [Acidobacteriota bacterium]
MKYQLPTVLLLLVFSFACIGKESSTTPSVSSPTPSAFPISNIDSKKTSEVGAENSFIGSIESIENKKKLIALIEKSENKEISLDLSLSNAQMLAIYDLGEKDKILVDLAYKEMPEDPFPNAGYQLIIKFSGEDPKVVFQDQNIETHRIKAKVTIGSFAGPNQGIMSATGTTVVN